MLVEIPDYGRFWCRGECGGGVLVNLEVIDFADIEVKGIWVSLFGWVIWVIYDVDIMVSAYDELVIGGPLDWVNLVGECDIMEYGQIV